VKDLEEKREMVRRIPMTAKNEDYQTLYQALQGLIQDETDALANLANSAALLFHAMEEINWAGFYLFKENQLILGPFQGKPACVRIALGKGVCGTAAQNRESIVVQDVHQFPGHIACDEASASEIVIPIIKDDKLMGVLDVDSPVKARFTEMDRRGLQGYVDILSANIRWEDLLR
jgi:L-methionine (R)-S-oxide reductase